jgi:hypothetical protein
MRGKGRKMNTIVSNELNDTQFHAQVEQLRQRYAKGSYICAGDVLVFQELARRYRNLINALKENKFG